MTLIIAEAGVNHNGSEELAIELVKAAHQAGADIVKFQTFKAEKQVTKYAKQAQYQLENTQKKETQFEMLKRLELSHESHKRIFKYCQDVGIDFLSTAFDSDSLNFLVNDINLQTLKIPSGEITNAPLILEHAKTGRNLIVSTGMATLAEIELALSVIAYGFNSPNRKQASLDAFKTAFRSESGKKSLMEKVTLLHCTTEYPAPITDINLKALDTMASVFNLPVGYSDHSEGIIIPTAAVARGATIIEKHFTLDKSMSGPDHQASLNPEELKEMVEAIRTVEISLGDGIKKTSPAEQKNKTIARKSLIAAIEICEGDIFHEDMFMIKRPGTGTPPYRLWDLLGQPSSRDYSCGDVINE